MNLDQEKILRIKKALKFSKKGMGISEIAQQLKINRNSVAKYLEILRVIGQVDIKKYGTSKVYSLSQTMPISAMMNFSSDLIILVDANRRIIQVNEQLLRFTGVKREKLIGEQIDQTGLGFLSGFPFDTVLTGKESVTETVKRKVQQDGREVSLSFKLIPTTFDDGTEGITFLIEDITERNRIEEALRESEEKYRSVIENIQDVFYRTDIDGNLIMASPSAKVILGYDSMDEGIGRNIADMFYMDPEKRKEFLDTIYRDGSVTNYEVLLKRKDGSPLHISTNSHLYYDDHGAVLGVEGIFRDVTALRKSEELFSNIAQHSPLPIAIIDPDGTYRYINGNFVKTFGYDRNDFRTGREWFLLAFPDTEYRKKVIDTWTSDFKSSKVGEVRGRLFTVRCKDGTKKEIYFRPVTLTDGKQCIVYEDVTGHIEAQRTQKLLSSIIGSTDDAIIGKDTNGVIISWNRAAERLYGYKPEEVIGHYISLIIPRERRAEMDDILQRIKNGDSVNNLETLRVNKDGKIIDVAVTVSPIIDDDGTVIGASTIARDISFKKTEKLLEESEENYRELVENITVGIYRSTGDPNGRFIWANPALVRILGFPSLDALKSVNITDLFEEQDSRKKFLEEIQKTGFVKNKEFRLKRPDGKTISVLVTAFVVYNQKGGIARIKGMVEDITDQQNAQSRLQVMSKEILDIVDFIPDPTFIIDSGGKVVAWNAAVGQLTGVGKEEILFKGGYAHAFPFYGESRPILIDLIDASDEQVAKYYPDARRTGSTLEAEVFAPAVSGWAGAYLWGKASLLFDHEGNRLGAIETIRDISDIRHFPAPAAAGGERETGTEKRTSPVPSLTAGAGAHAGRSPELMSLIYLSNALRNAQEGITILDLSARCVWTNDALISMVGAGNSDAVVGKSIAHFIAAELQKPTLDRLLEVRKNGHASFPLFLMTSHGRVPVEASVSLVSDEAEKLLGYMAIMRRV